jgi:hypothetical protein
MYTLADITKMTGAKRRSVQLWAEAGAIVAARATERQGSGVHREFDMDEAIVACVVAEIARFGVPIGKLVDVGDAIRRYLDPKKGRRTIEAAFNNSRPVYLSVHPAKPPVYTGSFDLLDNPTPEHCKEWFDTMDPAAVIVFLNACLTKVRTFK